MARDWHETSKAWAKPPSEKEEDKGSNAARLIKEALRSYGPLKTRGFETYATGSYRNNTNARLGSDIDVAAVLHDAFYYELPSSGEPTAQTLGFGTPAQYGMDEFRHDVDQALRSRFGSAMTPGTKAFNIHENTYRLDADVAVFLKYRLYTGKKLNGDWQYVEGVKMVPRSGSPIVNWHEQHYASGLRKNEATKRRFKRVVRILKRLRDEMAEKGSYTQQTAAKGAASFLIESLVYNVPNNEFHVVEGSYYEDVKNVVRSAWNSTKDGAPVAGLVEVNEMKPLFGAGQAWTPGQANAFLLQAWNYVGFPS